MIETSSNTILIVTDDISHTSEIDGSKSGSVTGESWADNFGKVETSGRKGFVQTIAFSTSALEMKMKEFIGTVEKIFKNAEEQAAKTDGMYLDEIELSIEISAKGEIKLIGNGIGSENKGAIKFKFKRHKN